MAGKGKSRKRLLREIMYLQEETSQGVPINIEELQAYLDDLTAIRAIIYDDLAEMEQMNFGMSHEKNGHYYYDRQSFTQGELALMIDLICCAGYPDAQNAEKLILHIKQLGNNEQFQHLSEQTNLALRNKPDNPECIRNTDLIHKAVRESHKIQFHYGHTNSHGITVHDKTYIISPYQLVWNSSHLYVIGGYENNNKYQIRNFRVDKITELTIINKPLRKLPRDNAFYSTKLHGFDAERYLKATFDMFNSKNGKTVSITFSVAKYLVGAIIDVFGNDLHLTEYDTEHMQFTAEIQITNMFFGWLAKFTYDQLHIISPSEVCTDYYEHLKSIIDNYK